jgi:hypothetical protein
MQSPENHSRFTRPKCTARAALSAVILCVFSLLSASAGNTYLDWAPKPPMGWNSWDCFGTTVTEAQTKAQADYLAAHLARFGWQYIVVDIQWYEAGTKGFVYKPNALLTMDGWGRLLPEPNRFPSATNDAGFKPIADYIHAKKLKFGVHLLRGIPRQAVAANIRRPPVARHPPSGRRRQYGC